MGIPSKTFCILPWVHLSTKSDGRVRQCCRASNFIEDQGEEMRLGDSGVAEVWNSKYMRDLRLELLNGSKPKSCQMCWDDEDRYQRGSRRQHENAIWNDRLNIANLVDLTKSDGQIQADPVYWDLRIGNKCNLKCIMCNPINSSLWAKETELVGKYPHLMPAKSQEVFNWADDPHLWQSLTSHLDRMNELYFSGGEPLMSLQHFELLETAVKKGVSQNIHLRYDTNGLLLQERHFDLWANFKSVWLNLSVDGVGATSEYIRFPFNWDKFLSICEKIEKSPLKNLKVNFAYSMSNMNVLDYLDFIDWKLTSNFKIIGNRGVTSDEVSEAHTVDEPYFLSIRCLLPRQKEFVASEYLKFSNSLHTKRHFFESEHSIARLQQKLANFIQYMNDADWSHLYSTFQKYRQDLDNSRGTDFSRTFSWMTKYE